MFEHHGAIACTKMHSFQASTFRAGQGTLVRDHVFRSVLLPKTYKAQTHRRKRWQRGSLQTYARRFGFSRHKEPEYQQVCLARTLSCMPALAFTKDCLLGCITVC